MTFLSLTMGGRIFLFDKQSRRKPRRDFYTKLLTRLQIYAKMITTKGGDKMMYKIKEVARILGFNEWTVRGWVRDGKIKAVKIMSEWRIPEEEVERLKRGE